jgi:Flp pilus assembly protein TadD
LSVLWLGRCHPDRHPKIDPKVLNKAVIDEHIAKFRRAVRADPNDETAHYGLGVAYFKLGLQEDAAFELTQAARLMPENPNIQAQLAVVHFDRVMAGHPGAETDAMDRVNRALLLRPKFADALLLKSRLHLRNGNRRDAVEALRLAATEQPEIALPMIGDCLADDC